MKKKSIINKKSIFTFCSVLISCTVLFLACEKSNAVTQAATTTTGGTTGTTAANSIIVDGTASTVTTSTNTVGNNFLIVSNKTLGGYPSISLTFTNTAVPSAGSYTPTNNYPTSGTSGSILTPAISTTWTVVTSVMTVTSGASRSVSFTNSTFTDGTSTYTVSANLPF